MSQDNVALVRQANDAFNRRDLDAFLALMDDDVAVESRLVAMEGGYHGHEGARRWWENILEFIPDYTVETLEVREYGDVTVGHIRGRGHGAASATPVEDPVWQVGRWRDGRCVWWRIVSTEAEALEAAGLRE